MSDKLLGGNGRATPRAIVPRSPKVPGHELPLEPGRRFIQLPSGRLLDEDTFYRERDHRTMLGAPYRVASFPVAVVLPAPLVDTEAGQTALIWSCSILRRMGRPFARTIIVVPPGSKEVTYRAGLHRARGVTTLGAAVELELAGADPFAPILWRALGASDAFADVQMVLWLGGWANGQAGDPPHGHLLVAARGWVVGLAYRPSQSVDLSIIPRGSGTGEEAASRSVAGPQLDAAAATVIAGAALAVGRVYRIVQHLGDEDPRAAASVTTDVSSLLPLREWVALDTGVATTDEQKAHTWWHQAAARTGAAPWRIDGEPGGAPAGTAALPRQPRVTLVSAGGLGGNLAQVLAASYMAIDQANIIDPDVADVSTLNRFCGLTVEDVGRPKADHAAAALQIAGITVSVARTSYEGWSAERRNASGKAPDDLGVVLIGVDQVGTRLEAQADWPALLINGGTLGTTWTVSQHPRGCGACVGCLYGSAQQTYADSRRPLACGAGVAGPTPDPRPPVASYSFVSVGAAAFMAAWLIDAVWRGMGSGHVSHGVHAAVMRMNALLPEYGTAQAALPHGRCLLLCGHEALDSFFQTRCPGDGLPGLEGRMGWKRASNNTYAALDPVAPHTDSVPPTSEA